jgi:gliding motility-associated-like protein
MSADCLESISEVLAITVFPPISNNKITFPETICAGTTFSPLTGSLPKGGKGMLLYSWESSTTGPSSGFAVATGVNDQQHYTAGVLTQTTWFRRSVRSADCIVSVSDPVQITVLPLPPAPAVSEVVVCPGKPAALSVQDPATGTYEWFTSATGEKAFAQGATFVTPPLVASTTYYVQQVLNGCPSPRTLVSVTVKPPTADAGPDVSVLEGRSTQLQGKGEGTYTWHPATGLSDPHAPNPVASPVVTTTYRLVVTLEGGCSATDEVTVSVKPHVTVPNAFTPNQDGINDVWQIEDIGRYPDCRVEVYNRWGQQVFKSEGYRSPWDGTSNNQPLPSATYYYFVYIRKNENPVSGSVTILRERDR